MDNLPLEIIQYIFDYLNFYNKIRFKQVNKLFYFGLKIYDFYNIPYYYKIKLSNEILINYPEIKYLDASWNAKITDVNHMTNLQKLNASESCGIDDLGLIDLNLKELNASNNPKIKHIEFMTNLKILNASTTYDLGRKQRKLFLKNLKIINKNIDIHNHSIIKENRNCIIGDKNLKNINLIELNVSNNNNIKNVNHTHAPRVSLRSAS